MHWYHYIACFFAGIFLANAVPHFVQGVSGDRFPTPFAHPPGKGLTSSTENVVWALFNGLWATSCFVSGRLQPGKFRGLLFSLRGSR
jgi:hypothetical protein